jgi:inner membrane protein
MTNGGLGVAFLSPLDTHRYFLPWRPIPVSPIGISAFFSEYGLVILGAEILLVWLPTLVFLVLVESWSRSKKDVTEQDLSLE